MNGELKTDMPTVADLLLVNLPDCVELLPEDWEGKTERAWIRLTVSQQAVNNPKFSLRGFVKSKFNNSLSAIRKRRNVEKLCMTHYLAVTVDQVSDKERVIFHIYIEYAI